MHNLTPHVPGNVPILALVSLGFCVAFCFAAARAEPTELPADAEYVTVRDGHLTLRGDRVRFWGTVGNFPARRNEKTGNDPHADNEAVVKRLKAMGFNMVRHWAGNPQPVEYVKGDGSVADLTDHFVWCLKREGMHMWAAALGGAVGKTYATPGNVDVIDDPATAEAWRQAVAAAGEKGLTLNGRKTLARTWDRRLEALAIRRMVHCANHVNQYTGLRWADDPVIAIWELHNEEWWFKRMNQGKFQQTRPFFLGEMLAQWNAFLKNKYQTDAALKRAWLGLLPGESLAAGTVLLLPVETPIDPAPQTKALGKAWEFSALNDFRLRLLREPGAGADDELLRDLAEAAGGEALRPENLDKLSKLIGDAVGKERLTIVVLHDGTLAIMPRDGTVTRRDIARDFARPGTPEAVIILSDGKTTTKPGGEKSEEKALRDVPVHRVAVADAPAETDLPPDANPASAAPQAGVTGREFGPDDFNGARAADVIEFLLKIQVAHKQREEDAVRPLGKGTRLCPILWDTGVGNEMQSQYMQEHGDAVAHCEYQQGIHWDPTHKRYPWHSMLEETPRLSPNREWETVEHPRPLNKPYLMYENQIHNPAKYRAEYPMLVASLAAIQDWDAVVWHYFGVPPDSCEQRPYDKAMDYSSSEFGHPQGFHFQYDEVQMSSMRAAAAVFTQGLLKPAPEPTIFAFGRRALHDLQMVHYGRAGDRFLPTTYRYGSRLVIDPTLEQTPDHWLFARWADQAGKDAAAGYRKFLRDGWLTVGPTYYSRYYEPNPYAPTEQITYDRQRGHLKFDAPAAAMYVGFFAQHGGPVRFGSGVTLRDVTVRNPEGIAYPVTPGERFVEFGLVATDGKPLSKCRRAIVSAVSTSFNSGFKLDESKLRERFWWSGKGATVSRGSAPVLVARVGATVEAKAIGGMSYRLLDWHLNEIAAGRVEGGVLRIPADQPVFLVELERR